MYPLQAVRTEGTLLKSHEAGLPYLQPCGPCGFILNRDPLGHWMVRRVSGPFLFLEGERIECRAQGPAPERNEEGSLSPLKDLLLPVRSALSNNELHGQEYHSICLWYVAQPPALCVGFVFCV